MNTAQIAATVPPAEAPLRGPQRYGITTRAFIIALVMTWLSGYWIRQSEIVALACQGTEAVPSIPGVGALILLVIYNGLARRIRFLRALSLGEMITIFLFVTVATNMFGCGIGRFLLACISAPFYYSSPAAPLEELARWIPSWMSPQDMQVHKWLYESSPTGHVPWNAWVVPILAWTGFFVMFGGALICLTLLFSEPWVEEERLVFPLVRLPLQIMDPGYSDVPFFKSRATWIGIGLATALNIVNMTRGVFFGGPSGGLYVDLAKQLVGNPWAALKPMGAHLRPELIGLGYLISTELSFSIWFFHLFNKLQAFLLLGMMGVRLSGVPYAQEQGIGAYVVLGVILFWKGRRPFIQAWQALLGAAPTAESKSTYRWALLGSIIGIIGTMIFARAAGMALWLTFLYFVVLILVSMVYARLRAETGVPIVWAFPYGLAHKAIRYFMNSQVIMGIGPDFRSPTIFNLFIFLSRGYFPTVSGYGIEGVTLGDRGGLRKGSVFWLLLVAVGFGALSSFYFHLVPFYERGAIGLRGGLWGSGEAQAQYAAAWKAIQMPVPTDNPRIVATLAGGGFLSLLSFLRARFFGSPFHPLGYAMACSYGDLLWGPFLVVWLIKTILLRYGGHKVYLNALPGFLGFALGHFVTAGAIWGSLGAALGGPFLRYGVWFG